MKNLTTLIGAVVLPIAGFLGGVEYQRQHKEWQNPVFNSQSINAVHELVQYDGRRGLLLTGKIVRYSFDSLIIQPEYKFDEEAKPGERRCVCVPRGKMNDFVWQSIVGRAFTNGENIDIYSSNYGYGFAEADMVGKNDNILYDLRTN